MEDSRDSSDTFFRDLTNTGHSLRPRTPEGKAWTERVSKGSEGGMVTGRVRGSRQQFLAADEGAFLPLGGVEGRQKKKVPRALREKKRQVGNGNARPGNAVANFLPGVPTQQVGQVNVRPREEMQGEVDGAVHQVKVENPGEEVALVGVLPEEANDLELASRKLRILKKKKEYAEGRVQFFAEKIAEQTQIVKDLAGQL